MEPGLLLLLLLTAPWGRGWAASRHASEDEMTRTDGSSVQPGEPGKYHDTSTTTMSPYSNICSSKCTGSTGCRQECQQGIDADSTTNCVNKCRDDSNCRGSRKSCHNSCRFRCLQPVPARPDTYPKKKVPHTIDCCNSTCSGNTECPNHLPCCPPLRRSSRLSVLRQLCAAHPAQGLQAQCPPGSLSLLGLGCHWCSGPRQLCHLAPERGRCRRRIYHYAYNPALRSCWLFVYGGRRGNANNFLTIEECRQVCQYGLDKR
ncbi:papilin-like isoform X2 [Meleagris gallopavo]|uniref:papilin-like isoform X2 n=1 Tax=Meleagris gallopavo TaxID=9103 RepID=UPI0005499A8A|nr:papilin-like isoform X2 [Meleagris gallopavo]